MKQCPACKNTYTDESLKFCLADGNLLIETDDTEQPTIISSDRNQMKVNIPQHTAPNVFTSPAASAETRKQSKLPLVIAALFALIVLAVVGIGAIFLFKPFSGRETAVVANNSNSSENKTNIASDNQNKELQDKIANLERQLQEQKNQNKVTKNQTVSNSANKTANSTPNNSSSPTATVKSSSDGFLSLRTEPSVKTGTQIIKIPTGATVQLENCEKNTITIDGRSGRWCMVSYKGETGWAFDAWLAY
jgi:hypothetical protein